MRAWTPRQHKEFEKPEPDLWCMNAWVKPGSPMRARMCVARYADGRLLFMNAAPLSDAAMQELEAWGTPAFLLVPARYHTLDVAPFKARYPSLKIVAPEEIRAKIAKHAPVDGGYELLPSDPRVSVIPLRGAKGECAVRVGATLCFPGDIVFNIPKGPWLMRLLGSVGGPRVPPLAKLFLVDDKRALREQLAQLSAGVERVVPCHGAVISENAPAVLQAISGTLT